PQALQRGMYRWYAGLQVRFDGDVAVITVLGEGRDLAAPIDFTIADEDLLPVGSGSRVLEMNIAHMPAHSAVSIRIGDIISTEGICRVPVDGDSRMGNRLDQRGGMRARISPVASLRLYQQREAR